MAMFTDNTASRLTNNNSLEVGADIAHLQFCDVVTGLAGLASMVLPPPAGVVDWGHSTTS